MPTVASQIDQTSYDSLQFQISEADLIANVPQQLVACHAGTILQAHIVVQKIITVGGTISLQINGVTVTDGVGGNLGGSIPNGSVTGTVFHRPGGQPNNTIQAGDVLTIVLSGFATAGRINGTIQIR